MSAAGCGIDTESADPHLESGAVYQELSDVPGCHFYVGSNYGGAPLHMAPDTTISNLRDFGMNDKISSLRLIGSRTRMFIDRNYNGDYWDIYTDVATLHTSDWGRLGDNASSIDCYEN
jgi:hypothetical protein